MQSDNAVRAGEHVEQDEFEMPRVQLAVSEHCQSKLREGLEAGDVCLCGFGQLRPEMAHFRHRPRLGEPIELGGGANPPAYAHSAMASAATMQCSRGDCLSVRSWSCWKQEESHCSAWRLSLRRWTSLRVGSARRTH